MAFQKNGTLMPDVPDGENPGGFVAQVPNGTMRNGEGGDGDEFVYASSSEGPRWNKVYEPNYVEAPASRRSMRKRG